MADLRGDGGVHGQRPDLLAQRHTLILLYVTGWDRMDQHFHADIFDARLEARPVDIRNLNEVILIARDVVPSAVKRNRHIGVFAFFESGASYHDLSMDVFFLLSTDASVHQGKVEGIFIESALFIKYDKRLVSTFSYLQILELQCQG